MCFMLVLVGCGGVAEPELEDVAVELSRPFSTRVMMHLQEDIVVEGELERQGMGLYEFEVSAPIELAGLCISATDEGVKLSYEGMEVELGKDLEGAPGIVPTFSRAMDAVLRLDGVAMEYSQEGYEISGGEGLEEFVLCLDGGAIPLEFSLPVQGGKMVFSEFKYAQ